ncbi:MAG: ADP-ribosylglycohydrolase family protein [Deltaproteobacteria bacterium]|uniref:ADP-ribosylglycohydrolase family protein n=1 Tax=Candidatus Zymogenus saltonus TaxID=2844893 RepID=A0A9D8KBV3_9DELT|nr:ADP-ribosylglycohydrolase family protein [Candidatus Zymogenus saltonus]
MKLRDIFVGSSLGTLVGDAFGASVEGWHPASIRERYGLLEKPINGRYTDDTQMMIGIMEAIRSEPEPTQREIAKRFLDNFDSSRGYGGRIFGVMKRIEAGIGADEVGTDSWGNGAAMRIAPIGCFFYDDRERLVEHAVKSAEITHKHPIGVAGAVAQAAAVAFAVGAAAEGRKIEAARYVDDIAALVDAISGEFSAALAPIKKFSASGIDEAIDILVSNFTRDVSAIGAVPASISAFLLSKCFADAVIIAVNAGGDADTTGAMAGAIAGAYYGAGAIPLDWLEMMEKGKKGVTYVMDLAIKLTEMKVGRNP